MSANASKLRKPSAASYKPRLPSPPIIFLDRSLGSKTIAASLRQAGVSTHVHDDHFAPDAKDQHWLSEVGGKKWIVLTKDKRIRHRTIERRALLGAGVRAFVLTAGNLQGQEMANIFLKALPAISRLSARESSPFIAGITRGGRVTILFHGRKHRGKR